MRHFQTREELKEHIQSNFQDGILLLDENTKAQYKGNQVPPLEMEKTKVLIVEGQLGVAENGAVWITEEDFPIRLLPFVTKQLVLVLDKAQIVSTMHEAYKRTELTETGFGVFISGPSKTADIEQSLVYGAHGAIELFVMIY